MHERRNADRSTIDHLRCSATSATDGSKASSAMSMRSEILPCGRHACVFGREGVARVGECSWVAGSVMVMELARTLAEALARATVREPVRALVH